MDGRARSASSSLPDGVSPPAVRATSRALVDDLGLFTLFSFALIDAGLALVHAIRRRWRDVFVASVLCLLTVGAIELTIADMVRSAFGAPRDAWAR